MAKRGPNGKKLNGKPEFPPAENYDNPGQRVTVHSNSPKAQEFRWRGRYFPGAMKRYREYKRAEAIERSAPREVRPEEILVPVGNKESKKARKRQARQGKTFWPQDDPARYSRKWHPSDGEAPNQDQMGLAARTESRGWDV